MTNEALARWAAAGLHEVTLPTGTEVKVRIPAPEALVRDESLPKTLRAVALKFVAGGVRTRELDPEELDAFLTLGQMLAVRSLRYLHNSETGEWEEVTLTLEQYEAMDLPPEDLTAIEMIAMRRLTPRQVTATSLKDLGRVTEAEAEQVQREEAGGTVDAYAPFRGQPGGAGPGADGSEVRPQPSP